MLDRLVDWCVPDSALRWGHLTRGDEWAAREYWHGDALPEDHVPGYWYPRDMPAPRRRAYLFNEVPRPRPEEFDAAPRDLIRHMAPPRGFGERDA